MSVDMKKVDDVFYRAQQCPMEDRDEFLVKECAGNSELREEVESLLAAAERFSDDFLEEPLPHEEKPLLDRRIGFFHVLEEIGRGGMGRVYLAERDDDLEQKVAIKVLKWGIDTGEIMRRFRRERRILAKLEHPYIARFLDGGTTGDGLPYLVMEHIRGEPIHRYCQARELDLQAKLELFRKVCSAVQFAHQNLVIHRDLKPGNVLVTEDGTPKLLDFSIAKLVPPILDGAPMSAPSIVTVDGFHPMTLAYASPEQVRGEPVNTTSDVYSLGVLLYRLLTGVQPYRKSSESTALELAQAICEEEATKPSTAARQHGDRPERGRRLALRLMGDLDSILLKALEKDPGRRYASVEQLSEDIRRHLEGLPILARDATFFYRFGKYTRRYWAELSAALVVLALIVGFSIRTAILKDRAVSERQRAEDVTEVMVGMFHQINPDLSGAGDVSLREFLGQNSDKMREELEDRPVVLADLLDAMGAALLRLRLDGEAEPLLEECLLLRRETPSTKPRDLADILLHLAELRSLQDRYGEADSLVEKAMEALRRDPDEFALAKALNNQAALLKDQGNLRAAEKLYRAALADKIRLRGERHRNVAIGQVNLAVTLRVRGKLEEADELYRRSLGTFLDEFSGSSTHVAMVLNGLGVVFQEQGHLMAAYSLLRRSLVLRGEIYGEESVKITPTLSNLAFHFQLVEDFAKAEELYERVLRLRESEHGATHSSVARTSKKLATLVLERGETIRATNLIRGALKIIRDTQAPGHWLIADAESVLGACLAASGRFEDAEQLLMNSLQILEEELGERARATREATERLERFRTLRDGGSLRDSR